MRTLLWLFLFINGFLFCSNHEQKLPLSFRENKGQVSDQFHKSRPDVLFSGMANDLAYHLKRDGISYQLFRVDGWKEAEEPSTISLNKKTRKIPEALTAYRLDITWVNCNKNSVINTGEPLPGFENFYLAVCPDGVTKVRSYEDVTYNNIYKGIDLHYYSKDGNLKYDYIVQPAADHKQIKLQINGAETIQTNANGELIIKTPLGEIIEQAPLVKQNGKILPAKWRIKNNIVSFEIENLDPGLPLVIDPAVRVWGTYFGGTNKDKVTASALDKSKNPYIGGETSTLTSTLIATVGSHQTNFGGGIPSDAYIARMDKNGLRIWSTYYGGSAEDNLSSMAIDTVSNLLYVVGNTYSSNAISTVGSHQSVFSGGPNDAFLAQFDLNGIRQWGSYYGGSNIDFAHACCLDAANNFYISGSTLSTFSIATAGSYQTALQGVDCYLAKFNSSGVRIWGTYYGAAGGETGGFCTADKIGNIYLCGSTTSTAGIATPGVHQTVNNGGQDAFVVKFTNTGTKLWASYFGDSGVETVTACNVDAFGNLIFVGETDSNAGLGSPGAHQTTYGGGGKDNFMCKFDALGGLSWSTYYGGSGYEEIAFCHGDAFGNIFLSGTTGSFNSISTPLSHQPVKASPGTGRDSYFVKFDYNGVRQWATYYGVNNTGIEEALTISSDEEGNVYFGGFSGGASASGTEIATPGTHQSIEMGNGDGYLAKFYECPTVNIAASSKTICVGNVALLTAMGVGTFTWDTGANTNTINVTPTVNTTYTVTNSTGTCVSTNTIDITVIPGPPVSVTGNTLVCQGKTTTLTASGAATYSWSTGVTTNSASLGPINTNTNYVVVGSSPGCINSTTLSVPINMNPSPTINVSSTSTLICRYTSATLTAGGANTYTWLATAVGSTAQVSPFVTTTFTVNGVDASGCLGTNTITVAVMSNSLMNVTSTKTVLCLGDSTLFTATGANTYTWSIGPVSPTVMITPTVTGTNSYSVNGTDGNGCIAPKFFNVLVYPNPTVTAVSNATMICVNQSATLTANGANTYSWNTSGSGPSIVVSPTVTTTYTVTGIDLNGCFKSTVITQSVSTCIGINETPNGDYQVNIFPNPNNGEFVILASHAIKDARLEIYNMLGQIIINQKIDDLETKASLREHSNGIYFVKVYRDADVICWIKIIKN